MNRKLFQSTHPRGVRLDHLRQRDAAVEVSIHAPAWGATRRSGAKVSVYDCFNPRTRVGCDVSAAFFASDNDAFQSTHPRGVRRYLWKACYFGAFHRYLRESVLFEGVLPAHFGKVFFFPYFSTRWLCGHLVWEKVVNWRFPNGILPVFPSFFRFFRIPAVLPDR